MTITATEVEVEVGTLTVDDIQKLPENIRQQMRRQVDAGMLHPDNIHPNWRADVMRDATPPHVLHNQYQVD